MGWLWQDGRVELFETKHGSSIGTVEEDKKRPGKFYWHRRGKYDDSKWSSKRFETRDEAILSCVCREDMHGNLYKSKERLIKFLTEQESKG